MPIHALHRLTVVFALVLCPCAPLRAAEAPAPKSLITATDLLQIKLLESPAVSPDGRWVAYVVRSIEPKPDAKEDWVYHTHLWIAATDGSTPPRQLTRGATSNGSPRWHPDGQRLVFVRSVEKEKPQLYVLELAGGDAQQFTRLPTGAGSPRWSPDGRKLLFTSTLDAAQLREELQKPGGTNSPQWNAERPGRTVGDTANWKFKSPAQQDGAGESPAKPAAPKPKTNPDGSLAEVREWLAKNEADNSPRVMTRFNFLAEGDLQPDLSFAQLYVMEANADAEPKPVALAFDARNGAEWLADSRRIVCVTARDPAQHPDRERVRSLAVADSDTGELKTLLERAEENYNSPLPSPDGRWIAFTIQVGGPFSFDQPKVAVIPAEGGEPLVLTAPLDRSAQNLAWSADGTHVYFIAASEGGFPLHRVSIDDARIDPLTPDRAWGVRDFAVGPTQLMQIVTRPENPAELLATDAAGKSGRDVTQHNSTWLAQKTVVPYEEHSFVNKAGMKIQYWTMKPAEFDAAAKYPLLVQIHGGPSAMWGPGEQSMWHEFQWYAAQGYAIVFSNPRGSGGYGRDFQRANYRDWGSGPAGDVLTAADYAAKASYIDRDRQVLTGGSYGGYLTAWILAHDQRFKAAVAQRGVYDLTTFFGEGNAWFLLPLYFGGYPWEPEVRNILNRESPYSYVDKIKTPLLIQHGDVDFRTGVIQSQMLYKSLKTLERPVEYVRYPRATHEMSRSGEPKHRLDSLLRYEEFFRRFIGK